MRTVVYVEVEAFACANLVAKIEAGKLDAAPIWTDIKTFDGGPFRETIHLITAGYPCQPFSVAGKRQGTDDPRHLWPHIERIVQAIRPVWCFFENVPGHLTIGFPEVYRSLRLMDYKVEAGLFTAAECGAPHKRERLFILANSQHSGLCSGKRARGISSTICKPEERQDFARKSQRTGKSSELADTTQQSGNGSRTARPAGWDEHTNCRWPARPGQPQYEWEEPRVVEHARKQKPEGIPQSKKRLSDRKIGNTGRQRQAQSLLGRATTRRARRLDAIANRNRIDRLRLLGNGVVPQCAEKAFRTLYALFEAPNPTPAKQLTET